MAVTINLTIDEVTVLYVRYKEAEANQYGISAEGLMSWFKNTYGAYLYFKLNQSANPMCNWYVDFESDEEAVEWKLKWL